MLKGVKKDFHICCPEEWQFSQANYNEEDSDDKNYYKNILF